MIIVRILQKVLVNHFYAVNAGFFLFAFFVLFGLPYQPLGFHRSLIDGIVRSQAFLGVVMISWVLYLLKCMDYTILQLAEQRQNFLFCLNSQKTKNTYWYLVYVQGCLYMPVLMYAGCIVATALFRHLYLVATEVTLFTIAALMVPAYFYLLSIQKRLASTRFVFPRLVSFHVRKHLFAIPLFYLWKERKQMVFVTKLFSLGVLYLFIELYEPDHNDVRPQLLCLLLVAGAHSSIVFQLRLLEEDYMAFSKNLPVTSAKRFLGLLLMFAVLLLPECLLLWRGYGRHFIAADYPQLILFTIALTILFYVTLLLENNTMEQYIPKVFSIMAALFFIILYGPGIALAIGLIGLSFALYATYAHSFEKNL